MISLEGWSSTIELYPRNSLALLLRFTTSLNCLALLPLLHRDAAGEITKNSGLTTCLRLGFLRFQDIFSPLAFEVFMRSG